MDKILLNDLSFHGYHGALPEENILGQHYRVSLVFELDTRPAAETDDLAQTVDYRQAIETVREIVAGPPVKLIETVAHRIAENLLREIPLLTAVTVRLTKPAPPVPVSLASVAIEIRRTRDSAQ